MIRYLFLDADIGRPPYITQGHLSMVSDKYYFATAFAIFGNSGGGLYSQKGSLLGIARLITTVRVKIGNNTLSLPEPNLPIFYSIIYNNRLDK